MLSAEYRRKKRLHVQNRSAGCILPCTNTSRQQEVPTFCFRKQGIPVLSTSLRSEQCPAGIFSCGAHSSSLPPSSRDIGNPISRQLVNTTPRPSSLTLPPVSVTKTLDLVGLKLNEGKSELDPVQVIQFLGLRVNLDQGRTSLPVSKAREMIACVCQIFHPFLSYAQMSQFMGSLNWASGLIPLGCLYLRSLQRPFHSLGLTNRFTPLRRSDPLVLANPLRQWQDLFFLPLESLSDLSRLSSRFLRTPLPRAGRPYGGFPDFGYLDPFRPQAPHRYGQHYSSILYQQTGWDPFPQTVTCSSGSVPMATNSGHSHPGQTHSGLSECDSGPSISTKSAHNNRV